jgi:hypothetical protein
LIKKDGNLLDLLPTVAKYSLDRTGELVLITADNSNLTARQQ